MPSRGAISLARVTKRPQSTTSTIGKIFLTRQQSTSQSNPPASSSKPSFSRAQLASFAAEGELLTTAQKNAPRLSQGSSSAASATSTPSKPLAFPKPVLKTNPYASNYTVSEADLGEFTESVISTPISTPSSSSSKTTLQDEAQAQAQSENKLQPARRGRKVTPIRRTKPLIRVLTDPELVHKPIHFNPQEMVTLHDGFIAVHTENIKQGVITWGRLRDSCTCKLCRDPSTSQRTFTTGQAMKEAYSGQKPIIEYQKNQYNSKGSIKITWKSETGSTIHTTYIGLPRLKNLTDSTFIDPRSSYAPQSFHRKLWDKNDISQIDTLKLQFNEIEDQKPENMLRMLEQLQIYGLVIIEGVPTNPTDDQNCYLRKIMGYIGEIRNTFYGETWNVKSMKQSKNVAYTNVDLGLHMDLLYFQSPPRFQALHCLRNRVNGGESYFVDSFKVASEINENLYNNLKKISIPYIYDNDNHLLKHSHFIIENGGEYGSKGLSENLKSSINWSPPFRDFKLNTPYLNEKVFKDLKKKSILEFNTFNSISEFEISLGNDKYKYEFKLKEGDLVLFDNRRILHARNSFKDKSEKELIDEKIELSPNEPTRWLKGCYLDGEVVWDKLGVLRRQADYEKKLKEKEEKNGINTQIPHSKND
ncbi:uncharacterized protein L201_000297 [Kwoniella dendrophila CBS 6074]|uniref:TauD/TfdA-like domain-containing protein n=1 Tax=Kwoniella dendrophila CBS 6074 TaxID=1295534 RepID=A0AAX4JL03_9TREE